MPRTNKILIRSGTVAPTASDFAIGEPGFDKSAGKLYVKNAAGTMVEIGAGGGGISDPYDLGSYPTITISAQPSAASVGDGASATFSVTATATLPTATITHQWQRSTDSGSTWANVSGATSSSYSFTASTAQTGYRYRCALTAGLSVVNSSSATLTVTAAASLTYANKYGPGSYTFTGTSTITAAITGGGDYTDTRLWMLVGNSGTLSYTVTANSEAGFDGGRLYLTSSSPASHSYQPFDAASIAGLTNVSAAVSGTSTSTGTVSVTAGQYVVLRYSKDTDGAGGTDSISVTLSIA